MDRLLTGRWHTLLMLNFEVDPDVLLPLVPAGTTLDFHDGKTYLSMVGFRFENARVRGWALPFHRHFDEVNLRFYVVREVNGACRRGVVFVKEIVPRRLVAWVARRFHGENFVALPMRSRRPADPGGGGIVSYEWWHERRWQGLVAWSGGPARPPRPGSLDELIAEHYWAYGSREDGTREYRVEHPPWLIRPAYHACCDCDLDSLYGAAFTPYLSAAPASAFVAIGSDVVVCKGRSLPLLRDTAAAFCAVPSTTLASRHVASATPAVTSSTCGVADSLRQPI
ncbi:MAG: DUF2071 domain-containing protein [Gemmataceae bacterium]